MEKIQWNDLLSLDRTIVNVKFPRSKDISNAYNCFIKKLSDDNITIDRYVKIHILKNSPFIISENLFPYNVDQNIKHLVFWINDYIDVSLNTAKLIVQNRYKFLDVIIFTNSSLLQSVKGIKHYQVFVKLK